MIQFVKLYFFQGQDLTLESSSGRVEKNTMKILPLIQARTAFVKLVDSHMLLVLLNSRVDLQPDLQCHFILGSVGLQDCIRRHL